MEQAPAGQIEQGRPTAWYKPRMLAIAALAALAIAGCGEEAPAGTVLSAEDYTKRVNGLCASVNADLESGSAQLTRKATNDAEIIADSIPKLEDANRKFLELLPPDELKDAASALALTNEQRLAANREAATAAKAGNQKAYKAALAKLEMIDADNDENASALGVRECVGDA